MNIHMGHKYLHVLCFLREVYLNSSFFVTNGLITFLLSPVTSIKFSFPKALATARELEWNHISGHLSLVAK